MTFGRRVMDSMIKFKRRVQPAPEPRMAQADVLRIAREEVERNGWPWKEPVRASFTEDYFTKKRTWRILTNMQCKGGNAGVTIDDENGNVLDSGFASH